MTIFHDMTAVTVTAAALVKAQAEFDAVAKQCGLIMKPLHDQLQEANDAHKQAMLKAAASEAEHIEVDLNTRQMLAAAQIQDIGAKAAD